MRLLYDVTYITLVVYWLVLNVTCGFAEATDRSPGLQKVRDSRCYFVVPVNWDWEGIWGMWVALRGYSPGVGMWLGDYYLCQNIYPLHYSACVSSKRSSGRSIWDLYSLTPSVIKQVSASSSFFPLPPPPPPSSSSSSSSPSSSSFLLHLASFGLPELDGILY